MERVGRTNDMEQGPWAPALSKMYVKFPLREYERKANYTHNVGKRYLEIANLYNGQTLDICSENWSQGVADASNQIQLREWLDLSKIPANKDEIYVNVEKVTPHDYRRK